MGKHYEQIDLDDRIEISRLHADGEFQREVQRFQAKRSLTSLPRSLKRAWIGVM